MQPPPAAARPLSVLVVDDDADTATGLTELLGLYGFSARAAYSGREALAAAESEPPDLVLLDLRMPRMTGWELAKALNALPEPPVLVAVSGVGGAAALERSASAGIRLHLVKPVDPPTLVDILRVIGKAATPRECVGAA